MEDNHVSSSSYFVRPAVSVPESVSPQGRSLSASPDEIFIDVSCFLIVHVEANATGRSHPTQIAGESFHIKLIIDLIYLILAWTVL